MENAIEKTWHTDSFSVEKRKPYPFSSPYILLETIVRRQYRHERFLIKHKMSQTAINPTGIPFGLNISKLAHNYSFIPSKRRRDFDIIIIIITILR